jgi:cytochrome c553
MIRHRLLRAAAGAGVVALALAGVAPAQTPRPAHTPDPRHGAVIAAQGAGAGASACARCHAFDGASDGSGAFPRIAGQSSYYLAKQMRDFTSDVRASAIMSPIAKALTRDDIADVAAYYAAISTPFPPLPKPDPALVAQGEQLAKVGNAARNIQACDNCHGPAGVGEPPAIPYLAGQYETYISNELRLWQQGLRKSSPEAMAVVAKAPNDQEIAAVAAYYQQVRGSAEAEASQ